MREQDLECSFGPLQLTGNRLLPREQAPFGTADELLLLSQNVNFRAAIQPTELTGRYCCSLSFCMHSCIAWSGTDPVRNNCLLWGVALGSSDLMDAFICNRSSLASRCLNPIGSSTSTKLSWGCDAELSEQNSRRISNACHTDRREQLASLCCRPNR